MAKDEKAVRRKVPVVKCVCGVPVLKLPAFQVDVEIRRVVKLHIFPFGQADDRCRVSHDFVDDNIVGTRLKDGKRGLCRFHDIACQIADILDMEYVVRRIGKGLSEYKANPRRRTVKKCFGRMTDALIN